MFYYYSFMTHLNGFAIKKKKTTKERWYALLVLNNMFNTYSKSVYKWI